ncbi:MAG TPA: hypothetical protein VFX16_30390 [Pseudonocardiaceae bacterium]|nr:hypothetical protein [Pseudonocardiaceae bacterium]
MLTIELTSVNICAQRLRWLFLDLLVFCSMGITLSFLDPRTFEGRGVSVPINRYPAKLRRRHWNYSSLVI